LHNTTKEPAVRDYFYLILSMLKNRPSLEELHTDAETVELENKGAIVRSSPLPMVIHALATLDEYQHDAAWIHSRLVDADKYSIEDIQNTLEQLVQNKIIVKTEGRYAAAEDFHADHYGFLDMANFKNGSAYMQKMREAFSDPKAYRPILTQYTMATMSASDFESIADAMQLVNKKIKESSQNKSPTDKSSPEDKNVYLYVGGLCTMTSKKIQPTQPSQSSQLPVLPPA